jgi:hypothetical protein
LAASSTTPADEQAGARVGEHVGHLSGLEEEIHRDGDAAGLEDAEVGGRELRHVGQLQGHGVARLEAAAEQPLRDAVRRSVEPGVAHATAVEQDGRFLWMAVRRLAQHHR